MADLTAACGEKILNPDFLLQGGGQPFADQKQQSAERETDISEPINNNNNNSNSNNNNNHNAEKEATKTTTTTSNGSGKSVQLPVTSEASNAGPAPGAIPVPQQEKLQHKEAKIEKTTDDFDPFEIMLKKPVITLYSQKMKGLKDLLLAEKLNTHAISLQVTAQSVASRKVRGVEKHSATISATITAIASNSGEGLLAGGGATGGTGGAGGAAGGSTGGASLGASSSPGGDSIAASRPKRTRRE